MIRELSEEEEEDSLSTRLINIQHENSCGLIVNQRKQKSLF